MLINGIEQNVLSASDRAVQFGDGCFTTAAVVSGRIQLLDAHLQRLKESCERLFMPLPDLALLSAEMQQLASGQAQAVLKVILTPGEGGRGYSRAGCETPTRILSLAPWPQHYARLQQHGATLVTSPVRLARNPLLAGLKHLNRLEQVLIRRHLDQTDADEALVLDTAGTVVECCAANLFWRKGERIYTPRLEQAGVNGIMRRYLMAQMAMAGQCCQLIDGSRDDVLNADEVVICNALMPVLPVRKIDDVSFSARTLYQQLHASCQTMEAT
ncbi:aminodeoxychorismate lyase [Pantoea sp. EA-12]|uniref:aminodeoxychorismate lyase n=1 Tax=Pantoea sp. EA-12 TaxID=3043303 RepID=UPI0024B4CCD5|nr:aminodeoxychorismate lyase [Pantoea sp. EA-12]MDI9221662.1 aminodeoxychorismate lyase [Pantoea sp. EA-12]